MFLSFSAVSCYAVWILMQFSANIIDYLIDNNYSWWICTFYTLSLEFTSEKDAWWWWRNWFLHRFHDWYKFRSINIVKILNFMSIIRVVYFFCDTFTIVWNVFVFCVNIEIVLKLDMKSSFECIIRNQKFILWESKRDNLSIYISHPGFLTIK